MKIAVIGSGISGLTATYVLDRAGHQVTLFEANDYIGGHTATKTVIIEGREQRVDTGFIVCNNWTYPRFFKLLEQLGVNRIATEMSFSVQAPKPDLFYNGHSLSSLFAQRRNLLRPTFWRMLWDIVRFNRVAKRLLQQQSPELDWSLGEFIGKYRFGAWFSDYYILPMTAAIWSSTPEQSQQFPLRFFLQFFENHGLLNIINRPQWYVIENGSQSYVDALLKTLRHTEIKCNCAVQQVHRSANEHSASVTIATSIGVFEGFDKVIFACHSDQALAMLAQPTEAERSVLSAIAYRANTVTLHQDESLLPPSRLAWAAWNYYIGQFNVPAGECHVSYHMNILQHLTTEQSVLVSLNLHDAIEPKQVLGEYHYHHPVYNTNTSWAQSQRQQLQGVNHSYFCGAYWYNGFHEDGVRAALDVVAEFGLTL